MSRISAHVYASHWFARLAYCRRSVKAILANNVSSTCLESSIGVQGGTLFHFARAFMSRELSAALAAAIVATSVNSMHYTRLHEQHAGGPLAPRMQRGQHSPACHEGRFTSLGGEFQGIS